MTFDGAIILYLDDVTQVNCVHLYGPVLLPYFGLNCIMMIAQPFTGSHSIQLYV